MCLGSQDSSSESDTEVMIATRDEFSLADTLVSQFTPPKEINF